MRHRFAQTTSQDSHARTSRIIDQLAKVNPRCFTSIIFLLLSSCAAPAVSPLVTDDADTVEPGRLQLNMGWQFSRTASVSLHSIPVNPVIGLHSRGELGLTFGYQWRDGFGSAPNQNDAGDITDLTLASKWRLWQSSDEGFKLSARLDLKLPTASEHRGFGTGDVDASGVLLATRGWGRTCLDWNVGYTANDVSRGVFGDDRWFFGQAVRHEFTERWTLMGETYALLPQQGASANFHFNGGVQFSAHESFLLSALIGSATGRNSPDLTSYFGFTWVF
jgi:hypothetical protein